MGIMITLSDEEALTVSTVLHEELDRLKNYDLFEMKNNVYAKAMRLENVIREIVSAFNANEKYQGARELRQQN